MDSLILLVHSQVLRTWLDKSCEVTVADFIGLLGQWQKADFISLELSAEMKNYVDPQLLPGTLVSEVSSGGRYSSSRAGPSGVEGQNRKGTLISYMKICFFP